MRVGAAAFASSLDQRNAFEQIIAIVHGVDRLSGVSEMTES